MPQFVFPLPFQIDHIVAEKHGGETVPTNLALACPHCNLYKGPNIAGRDPDSGQVLRLFHPRSDSWTEHFQFEGPRIVGRTPVGRVTVQVLALNAEELLLFRVELLEEDTTLK
jgi:HNH endonuclease